MKIVIASVLKPADETRMFGKIGATLSTNGYEVHLIGQSPTGDTSNATINIHATGDFARLSLKRLLAPFRVFRKCIALKPDVLIIATHELLFMAILMRVFLGVRIVYDVQENYFLNIRYSSAFPPAFRWLLAMYVRCVEWIASPFIRHFLLAEVTYENELPFIGKRYTILENTFVYTSTDCFNEQKGFHKLLFTGTLADTTGVFEAIALAKRLHAVDSNIQLTVVGFASKNSTLLKLKESVRDHPYIQFITDKSPVSHEQIRSAIALADYGIICYPPNRSTTNRIPTKYFEYTALGLRILTSEGQSIASRVLENNQGLVFQRSENAELLLQRMQLLKSETTCQPRYWHTSEAPRLLEMIKSLK